ncbi:MAG: glycosyltransferase family 2 protein [Candidatus Accumulibacter sp.]|uniref:glycosyltransferase family 2 protein n=1 Tax=Accumulibacter sp. TaxID=2053492 RepID=UPI001AC3B765|nr:glycosyltransferase family 2 protein [Accumulibacter sp.]MBN8516569.1 glycosyltransferase family 2 protein [Accumulibacter sp.]MBO3710202.1 glycosyltransferase family 2 protein [Accumulibacter sp.]HMW55169.1 glycosyltransferase family 2 protein [Accumulibacter sp.]HNC20357.1 glycosyltransferase family 2 protein [Accumulibacter sp.]HNO13549.1 glycosyltransferase family 2 protein [Accumulibacter sp.]
MISSVPPPLRHGPPRPERPRISCVVPALNEHDSLLLLLPEMAELLNQISSAWEIIVVDDGSTDRTPQLMTTYVTSNPGVYYLQLSRNFGKEAALSAGLEVSSGDVVICIDADLQHPLALIPEMLVRWQAGVDTVYAVKRNRDDESWLKRVGASIFYGILGQGQRVRIPPDAGDFRLMDKQVVDALIRLPERTRFMKGLYAWVGFKAEPMPYVPAERLHGQSHFNLLQLIRFAVDGITAFSTWPLRTFNLVGSLIAMLSFCYGSYLVIDYLINGHDISGWTTIVTGMFFFSGINLMALGTMGAYIARIFDEVKQRPLYVVKRNIGQKLPENES